MKVAKEFLHRSEVAGWTPERLISARDLADDGNLQLAADACEQILTDDRVDGVLNTRVSGLLGLPLRFVGGSTEAVAALAGEGEAPGDWWRFHEESELSRLLRWGIVLGVGFAQRIPLPRFPGQSHKFKIETWHPRWFDWSDDEQTFFATTKEGRVRVTPGDGQWIVYTPFGSRRPWAYGAWTKLAFPWIVKRFSLEDRSNQGQITGGPIIWAEAPHRSTEKQRRLMGKSLMKMTKDSRFVMPEGWKLHLLESGGTTTFKIHEDQIKWANDAITIVLAGQLVTTEGTQGFSSGNVQDNIKQDFIRYDAESASTTLREQSLCPWANLNYGSPDVAPWPRWNTEKPVELESKSRQILTLGQGLKAINDELKKTGREVDIVAICDQFEIPVISARTEGTSVNIPLAPTDVARAVTFNEVRRAYGLADLPVGGDALISGRPTDEIAEILGLPSGTPLDEIKAVLRTLLSKDKNAQTENKNAQ